LNYEGIGNTGPSILLETGQGNKKLISEFANVVSNPLAQSWLFTVYKLTPMNTDFNSALEKGILGYNFIYMDGGTVYHTLLDNPETIDMRSLQHHGSYTLSLILHFGNKNISETIKSKEDSIYFSPFLGVLIKVPIRFGSGLTS